MTSPSVASGEITISTFSSSYVVEIFFPSRSPPHQVTPPPPRPIPKVHLNSSPPHHHIGKHPPSRPTRHINKHLRPLLVSYDIPYEILLDVLVVILLKIIFSCVMCDTTKLGDRNHEFCVQTYLYWAGNLVWKTTGRLPGWAAWN